MSSYFDEETQTFVIKGLSKKQGGELRVRRFNMKHTAIDGHAIFIAPTKKGKTTVLHDYMVNKKDGKVFCFSGTEAIKPQYSNKLVPALFVDTNEDGVDEEKLNRIIEKQVNKFNSMTNREKEEHHKSMQPEDYQNIIIDDHFESMNKWSKYTSMKRILTKGRHFGTTMSILTQAISDNIPSFMKSSMSYVFICGFNGKYEKEAIFKHYSSFETLGDFEKTFNFICDEWRILVFDRDSPSNKLEDKVFWYKSDMSNMGNYRMGTKEQWEFSRRHYREIPINAVREPEVKVNPNIVYFDVDKTDDILNNPIVRKYNNIRI